MVLSTGVYLQISGNSLSAVTGSPAFSGAALLVLSGVLVAFVALIGVMAAASLSWQLLLTVSWPAVLCQLCITVYLYIVQCDTNSVDCIGSCWCHTGYSIPRDSGELTAQ